MLKCKTWHLQPDSSSYELLTTFYEFPIPNVHEFFNKHNESCVDLLSFFIKQCDWSKIRNSGLVIRENMCWVYGSPDLQKYVQSHRAWIFSSLFSAASKQARSLNSELRHLLFRYTWASDILGRNVWCVKCTYSRHWIQTTIRQKCVSGA